MLGGQPSLTNDTKSLFTEALHWVLGNNMYFHSSKLFCSNSEVIIKIIIITNSHIAHFTITVSMRL